MVQLKADVPIETIELVPIAGRAPPPPTPRWFAWRTIRQTIETKKWLLIFVVAPTVLASIYFLLIAANRYESVSRFVVRSPSSSAANQLTGLVQGSGIIRSSDDAYIVHAYFQSRDAVRKLAAGVDLVARLGRNEADIFWRYPGPLFAPSEERLWRHFQSLLTIDYDKTTGISTLKVQAFRPDDAKIIADAMLDDAEALINRLSERSRADAIAAATRGVDQGRERARDALNQITEFRRKNAIIDPGRVSAAALETMTRLSLEIAQTNAQLAELTEASPDSPQANTLRIRIAALQTQIAQERQALAGTDTSLAPLIAEYERLGLEREFAERTFASVQSAFDIARTDAERQRLFLERISTPALPDYPTYPRSLLNIFAVLAISWMLFSIGRHLISDTRAHAGN